LSCGLQLLVLAVALAAVMPCRAQQPDHGDH
jgi:hypothetical protein